MPVPVPASGARRASKGEKTLAVVVAGGMITTLFLTRYLMPAHYSFYGHRPPKAGAGGMAH